MMDPAASANLIAIINVIATVIAVITAPIIALRVGRKLQKRTNIENAKLTILGTLMSNRHANLSPEAIKSLNLIDVVFADDKKVKESWTKYYAALSEPALSNPVGYSIWAEKRRDLLLSIIESVGYSNKVSSADILRAYAPQAVGHQGELEAQEQILRAHKVHNELLALGYSFPLATTSAPENNNTPSANNNDNTTHTNKTNSK